MTKEKWKIVGGEAEKLCVRAVKLMTAAITGFLCCWTALSTFRFPADYSREWILEYEDHPWKNLAAALLLFLAFFLAQKLILRGDDAQRARRVFRLALIDVAAVGVLLCVWVTVSPLPPIWDQLQVFDTATDFVHGNFEAVGVGYLRMYVQQYGLIFLESALIRIWGSYRLVQYINVIFVCLILFLLYRVADLLFHNQTVNLYCLMGGTLFLPMYLYVTYVYGDLCSAALCLAAMWGGLRWNVSSKRRYLVISLVCAVIATLARENSLIPLIALGIVFAVIALARLRWKALLWGLVLLLPLLCGNAVRRGYEIRSGREIGDGIPAEAWIAMGMQGEWGGSGIYNGYAESIFGSTDGDTELTRDIAREYIRRRVGEFRENPAAMREFYRYKILEQWSEPSYASLTLTGKRADEAESELTRLVYFGWPADALCRFMNYYQNIVYLFVFCYAVGSWRRREGIESVLLLIAVIGGFLFSLLWEAKARYVIPYMMFLVPYMALGMDMVQRGLLRLWRRESTGE